jgi:hypothetical protein
VVELSLHATSAVQKPEQARIVCQCGERQVAADLVHRRSSIGSSAYGVILNAVWSMTGARGSVTAEGALTVAAEDVVE